MSQSQTHVLRRQATNVLYPYSEELAGKQGFILLTIEEAKEQGLLDRRRHPKAQETDPQLAELVALTEAQRDQNILLTQQIAELQANAAATTAPAIVPMAPEPAVVEPTTIEDQTTELSGLLAEIDEST